MKLKVLCNLMAVFVVALFSYTIAKAQVVDAVKDAADKTKEVTIDTTKKTVEVTKNVADKTKDIRVNKAKKNSSYTVKLVDNVKGRSYEGGKWIVVTTWNGTKWVSKRTWIETKKATTATKNTVVGTDDTKQP